MTCRHSRAARALGLALLIAAVALGLGSCSSKIGWGVVLWTAPEGPLPAGSVVPVYIKSNIQQLYVVGIPNATGKEKGKKIELPLWQVELYSSRGKANARVKSLGENVSLYMLATRDGLPIREEPSNDAKRVYRLHEGQSVKVLEKVQGDEVSTGGKTLPGSWYRVLTDDGSQGFAFSYSLKIYDETKEGPPSLASAKSKESLSGRVDLIFSKSWRPEYFQEMLDEGRIDLDYFSLRYGLFTDAIRRQVRIELPASSQLFSYSNITESNGQYVFEGSPLVVSIESDSRIVCTWNGAKPDADPAQAETQSPAPKADDAEGATAPAQQTQVESAARAGTAGSAAFVSLGADLRETIRLEGVRRQQQLAAFVDRFGADWGAPDAGKLVINKNGSFIWKSRGAAAGLFVPAGSGDSGEIAFRLSLDPSLAASWQGCFSLRFGSGGAAGGAASDDAAVSSKQQWLDFVYRATPAGLVLSPATDSGLLVSSVDDLQSNLVLSRASE
jgi:hypothetical protein